MHHDYRLILNIILDRFMLLSSNVYSKVNVPILHWLCRMLICPVLIVAIVACQKDDINKRLVDSGSYAGTFSGAEYIGILRDSVYLNISDGYYYCYTNLPYNYGAGILEISETKLNFIDTLFFPIPALYITGFALSGEYKCNYDGVNLILEKLTNNGKLIYTMKKAK